MPKSKSKKKEKLVLTKTDIAKIEQLAGYGLDLQRIAMVWDRCRRTFERHAKTNPELKEAIDRGREKANCEVAQTAYKLATSGKVPAMTMFWLKCRANWKETKLADDKEAIEDIAMIIKNSYNKNKNKIKPD